MNTLIAGDVVRLVGNNASFCNESTVRIGDVGEVNKVDGVMAHVLWTNGHSGWARMEQLKKYDRRNKLNNYAIISPDGILDAHLTRMTKDEARESLREWGDGHVLVSLMPVAKLRVNKDVVELKKTKL